ncbi:MAG: hypothetical protein P4L49_12600 [Desulfosporosinus sp.]|nr:hypothetical protein [Desulfosporosinus sp.]
MLKPCAEFPLGPGYLSNKRSGRVQSLVLDGIESLEPFFVYYVPQIITIAISRAILKNLPILILDEKGETYCAN